MNICVKKRFIETMISHLIVCRAPLGLCADWIMTCWMHSFWASRRLTKSWLRTPPRNFYLIFVQITVRIKRRHDRHFCHYGSAMNWSTFGHPQQNHCCFLPVKFCRFLSISKVNHSILPSPYHLLLLGLGLEREACLSRWLNYIIISLIIYRNYSPLHRYIVMSFKINEN